MQINSESRIQHPRSTVYSAYRDRLPEVVPYIPDIKEIRVESRESTAAGVKLHNLWIADREIPRMVQNFLKPEMLRWNDYADWNDDKMWCDWTLQIPAFPNNVTCSGRNAFYADGETTRVVLTGSLEINPKFPGIPRLLANRLAPQIEKFIVMLITPNLERVNQSLGDFLDAQ
ncbi:MAG: hypothetical protein ACI8RZ_000254 [Myxococcota bacterium]|jgi:hypothetical protein